MAIEDRRRRDERSGRIVFRCHGCERAFPGDPGGPGRCPRCGAIGGHVRLGRPVEDER